MISYIKGELTHAEPSLLWVECSGIGYALRVSLNTYSKLKDSKNVFVYTHLHVREDALQLYGFYSPQEKQWFEMLTAVSGVGGSTALAILSKLSTDELNRVIQNADVTTLKSVKGIGEKTAGRILLELKGKVSATSELNNSIGSSQIAQEAISALVSLGYEKKDAEKNVTGQLRESPNLSLEDLIRNALRG